MELAGYIIKRGDIYLHKKEGKAEQVCYFLTKGKTAYTSHWDYYD